MKQSDQSTNADTPIPDAGSNRATISPRHEIRSRLCVYLTGSSVATLLALGCTEESPASNLSANEGPMASVIQALGHSTEDAEVFTFSIPLPGALSGQQAQAASEGITLVATQSLKIADRAVVEGGVAGAPVLLNAGVGPTYVGADAVIRGSVLTGGSIELRDRVYVTGDVTSSGSSTRGSDVKIDGKLTTNCSAPKLTLHRFAVTFEEVCHPGFEVAVDTVHVLEPDSYGSVTVKPRGTLRLSAGRYYFDSLDVHSDARISVNDWEGAVEVYIRSALAFKGKIVELAGIPAQFLVATPSPQTIFIEAPFKGTLVAPNANVALQTTASHRGAVVAKSIELQAAGRFTGHAFDGWYALDVPEDSVVGQSPPRPDLGVPPPLIGQANPALALTTFLNWYARSTLGDHSSAIAQIRAARTDAAFVDAVVARAQALVDSGDLLDALAVFGILGVLRRPEGEAFFTQLLDQPLPPDYTTVEERTAANPIHPARKRRLTLLNSALQGLAFMGSTSARLRVLSVAAKSPLRQLRIQALRTYLLNYGESIGRSELLKVLRPDDTIFLDRPEMISFDGRTYSDRLAAFRAAHPEYAPRSPVRDPTPEPEVCSAR